MNDFDIIELAIRREADNHQETEVGRALLAIAEDMTRMKTRQVSQHHEDQDLGDDIPF